MLCLDDVNTHSVEHVETRDPTRVAIVSDNPALRSEGPHMATESSSTPVLDTLAAMTAESMARCELDANALLAARIAALAAVDAPAASYLMHVGPAIDAGVTLEQIQNILVAIAPIIGTPRTASAALNINKALGVVIVALEEELAEEEEAQ